MPESKKKSTNDESFWFRSDVVSLKSTNLWFGHEERTLCRYFFA